MDKECRFSGTGISNGKVSGKIKFLDNKEHVEKDVAAADIKTELKRFEEARRTAVYEARELAEKTRLTLGRDEAEIFDIHAMLVQDEDFIEEIIKRIEGGEGAAKAHFGWHMLSGSNAFDIFYPEEFKEKIDEYPAAEAPLMQRDFTRVHFGWWGFWPIHKARSKGIRSFRP